jgi:hypothetical protein
MLKAGSKCSGFVRDRASRSRPQMSSAKSAGGSCSLSRGDTSAEPITFYLNMPPMTEAKKITAATRSNPATIFCSG